MIHKRLYLYAAKVLTYWQFEYEANIASDTDMLLNTPILTQIVTDCYTLKIRPCNCCGIIRKTGLTSKYPDKPSK